MSTSDTTSDAPPRKRRRLRWWHLYLPLMLASFVWQVRTDGPDPLPTDYRTVELAPQDNAGPIEQRVIDRDGESIKRPPDVTLAYQQLGPNEGPVVILLHGSPGNSANFTKPVRDRNENEHPPMAQRLADAGYRVVAPDLPGFGYSTPYVPNYSNISHARYLLALMDQLEIDHAHLVGFSMGGGVALHTYDLAPERVDSITMFAAIGVQEGEYSGDYHFEHMKYALGFAGLVVLPEFVPHFGALGDRSFRNGFLRNFWDTDQRPNRAILERFDKPMLIVHGESDPLVQSWAAYEHHRLVEQSELVMYGDADFEGETSSIIQHAMIFTHESTTLATDPILSFLDRIGAPGYTPAEPIDRAGEQPKDLLRLPGNLELRRMMSPWAKIGVIIVGTFILEDPTSIAVGLFIKAGQIDLFLGVFAVLTGIFLGDLGLYMIGFVLGRRALKWKPVARFVPTRQVDALGAWFDKKGWKAVLASRFIPGSRLPLYVAAGVTGNKPGRFMLWTFLAVCVWVPVILFSVILLGNAAKSPFQALLDRGGWVAFVGVVLVLMVVMNTALMMLSQEGRRKLAIRFQKLSHHEFWPAWMFYLPLVPYLLFLAVRYRSTTVWTLADPCMPDGGVVGESKSDILSKVDDPAVLPHMLIPGHQDVEARIAQAKAVLASEADEHRAFTYPVILKPDAAQRGAGVAKIQDASEFADYFAQNPGPAQLQSYHPGPYEAGIFYIRMPEQETSRKDVKTQSKQQDAGLRAFPPSRDSGAGMIFSITDKTFPVITGDGVSTLEQLIWQHKRYRCQHDTFHARFADDLQRVLADGETLRLAEAGNHAQGTMFTDGQHLITPQLTAAIDRLCRKIPGSDGTPGGYCFGRIDVRYADPDTFMRGEGLAVIELNGVTSESTNIYDPSWSIFQAQRTLRRQWRHCFEIGDAHRRQGMKPKPLFKLLRDVLRYYRERDVTMVSD
ncbi:MAG: alpha/beta fold hydrolase [Phycisphaerales bacterium JB063]